MVRYWIVRYQPEAMRRPTNGSGLTEDEIAELDGSDQDIAAAPEAIGNFFNGLDGQPGIQLARPSSTIPATNASRAKFLR